MTRDYPISGRRRALIKAAAILDDPDIDQDSDIALLAWQLTDAQKEIEELNAKLKHLRVISQGHLK